MNKNLIKHSINLLEYPLWFQDERLAENTRGLTWSDREGYTFRAGYKVPVKTDSIFLLYLLLQSQQANYKPELVLTRYQVLKDCGLVLSQVWYDRLEDSLERWKMVGIKFEGTFYDGKAYASMNFGIIDSWKIDKKTKNLHIRFSQEFLTMMLGKGFFKYINFSEFKQLRSPLATRLYEILCKSFHSRDTWEINAIKLAEKIPMKERFPAHIVPKIKTAVSRINRCTTTNFTFETRKSEDGQVILSFQKLAEVKQSLPAHEVTEKAIIIPEIPEVKVLINLLPSPRQTQQTILEIIIGFYEMQGFAYVERNIRYTNKHAKNNYRSYLMKAMQSDYGLAMQEDEEAKRLVIEQETKKQAEIAYKEAEVAHRRKLQVEAQQRAQAYIETLSPHDKAKIELEAIANMAENIRSIVQRKGTGTKVMLNLAMESIATRRIEETKVQQPSLPTMEVTE